MTARWARQVEREGGRRCSPVTRRRVIGLAIVALLIGTAGQVSVAHGQLFGGQRSLGRTISPRQRPGSATSVGTLRNQRFLRGNRRPSEFVGTDRRDAAGFVGRQEAGSARLIGAALAPPVPMRRPDEQVNQPVPASVGQGPYPPKLHVNFPVPQRDEKQLASEIEARLTRLGHSIEVSVADHVATIRGKVASEEERRLAAVLVSFEPGVWEIQNELQVDPDRPVAPSQTAVPSSRVDRVPHPSR